MFEHLKKPVKSVDFDGVLHRSVVGTEPIDFMDPTKWKPFDEMIAHIKELSKDYYIVCVTARDSWNAPELERFIEMHDIPIQELHCTDNEPKLDILLELNAETHYDDKREIGEELAGSGIEFVLVNPHSKTWSVPEWWQKEK